MTAKEYLSQIRRQDIRIGQRIRQLQQMRDRITFMPGIDYAKDRVQSTPTSGNKDIEAIVDLEKQIARMVRKEEELKHKIIGQIQLLENPVHVDLLFRRYVDMNSFEQISCDMGYAYNYVCNLHGEALQEFESKVLNLS